MIGHGLPRSVTSLSAAARVRWVRPLSRSLIAAGAVCHVPCLHEAEDSGLPATGEQDGHASRLPAIWPTKRPLTRFTEQIAPLWDRSISLAVLPLAPIARHDGSNHSASRLDMNFMSCTLCCRAAVKAMSFNTDAGGGGRIVNVAARPGLEWRSGAEHGRLCRKQVRGRCGADGSRLAEESPKTASGSMRSHRQSWTRQQTEAVPKADFALWPKVEEVAATIVFLVSPDNRVTRGAIVPVYGKS